MKAPGLWWEQLDFLAPDARADFGRIIELLERGLASTCATPRSDDPAGWSGLSRRGPWERLLPSEWALAELSPEEFARRAGEGELAFWDLARESLEQSRSVWVWVDVGPDQLGACRVVQIALLLYLQRLCRLSGGEFYWGAIQQPEKGYEQFGAEELCQYLASRSVDPPRCPPERIGDLQVWCVGSQAWMSQVPAGFRRIALDQVGPCTVELCDGDRRLSLPLPAGERAARLLRNPMVWSLAKEVGPLEVPTGPMAFSPCGRKLMVACDDHITVCAMPSSNNEHPSKPRVFPLPRRGRVLALSMEVRAIHVVQERGEEWVFFRLNPSHADQTFHEVVEALPSCSALGSCWRSRGAWHLWLDNRVYRANEGKLEAVTYTRGGFELASSSLLATIDGRLVNREGQTLHTFASPAPGWVYLARAPISAVPGLGFALACQHGEREWSLLWKDGTDHLSVEGRVQGLVSDSERPALLVQDEGRWRLQGAGWSEPVALEGPIEHCLLHPNGLLAYRTSTGELGCYGFQERGTRWRARA